MSDDAWLAARLVLLVVTVGIAATLLVLGIVLLLSGGDGIPLLLSAIAVALSGTAIQIALRTMGRR